MLMGKALSTSGGAGSLIIRVKLGETVSRPTTRHRPSVETSQSHHASAVRHRQNRRFRHCYPAKGRDYRSCLLSFATKVYFLLANFSWTYPSMRLRRLFSHRLVNWPSKLGKCSSTSGNTWTSNATRASEEERCVGMCKSWRKVFTSLWAHPAECLT